MGKPDLAELKSDLVRTQIERGNPVKIRVHGFSMMPLLWPGCELTVVPFGSARPEPGDIVAIVRKGRLVFHQVYGVNADGSAIYTRGVASLYADPPSRKPEWVGRVAHVEFGPFSISVKHVFFRVLKKLAPYFGIWFALARALYLKMLH